MLSLQVTFSHVRLSGPGHWIGSLSRNAQIPSATSSVLSGVTPRGFWVCRGASYWWDMPGTLHTGGIQVRCLTTTAGFSVGEPFSHDWTPHPVYKGKASQLSEEALKLLQLVSVILFFQSLPKLAIIGDSRDVRWLLPVSFAFTLSMILIMTNWCSVCITVAPVCLLMSQSPHWWTPRCPTWGSSSSPIQLLNLFLEYWE